MKKFVKILTLILFTPILFLSGCIFPTYDDDSNDSGVEGIAGYKVCYKNETYTLDNTFELYSQFVLQELYVNFGVVSDQNKSLLSEHPLSTNPKNYDRIRVQVLEDDSISNTAWKWTFARSLSGAESLTEPTETVEYYSSQVRQEIYLNEFLNTYTTALEIVCIQIAMGETPYTYTIQTSETTQNTSVFAGTVEVNDQDKTLLQEVKTRFSQTADYAGLTAENIETLKSYILTNIIGDTITNTYNKIYFQTGVKTYQNILDSILALSPSTLSKSILTPYPTAYVKDITDSSFNLGKDDDFSHIQSLEYQSFVIMPSEESSFGLLMFKIESEYDISITIHTYFVENNTRTTLETQTVSITGSSHIPGETFATNMPLGTIDEFENAGTLKADSEKIINNQNGNNIYYTQTDSNIAVLDENKISNNYVEIAFEINKTTDREYWPFKVAIQGFM